MNVDDLNAYKNLDPNAYGLIPGILSSKYRKNRHIYDKYKPS